MSPSPSSSTFLFTLSPDSADHSEAAVFDVRGREVRSLEAPRARSGGFSFGWDGRDDGGRRVPAGTYYVRVKSPRGDVAARVVLVR
ncbi:MAG: hypothetical protein H6682_16670 [Candidatus Eisenbacteria bacterium]|nr:hypothetical protein [Candidatus Eisenbacteria bacterium]